MSKLLTYKDLLVSSAGGNFILDNTTSPFDIYLFGSPTSITLLDNVSIGFTGTPYKAQEFIFSYTGNIITNGKTIDIFGTELSVNQALYQCEIKALFDGSVWNVFIFNDSETGNTDINGVDIIDGSISTDKIADNSITLDKLSFTLGSYLEATLTIPSASVLTLSSIPIDIVSSPGIGKYIEVISATSNITFVSTAYTTSVTLQLINNGANIAQSQDTTSLISTVSKITRFKDLISANATQTQILPNTSLQVKVPIENPTLGNSNITIKVLYRIVTI